MNSGLGQGMRRMMLFSCDHSSIGMEISLHQWTQICTWQAGPIVRHYAPYTATLSSP